MTAKQRIHLILLADELKRNSAYSNELGIRIILKKTKNKKSKNKEEAVYVEQH